MPFATQRTAFSFSLPLKSGQEEKERAHERACR